MDKQTIISTLENTFLEKDFDQLELIAKQAMQDFPEEIFGYNYLAEALMEKNVISLEAVEMCLIKMVQLDEKNTEAMLKLAKIKAEQGEEDTALALYKNILAIDPMQTDALNALGEYFLYVKEDTEAALAFFSQAVGIVADKNSVGNKAAALLKLERFTEAEELISMITSAGFDEKAFVIHIQVLTALAATEKSAALYQILVEECPENGAYHYNFAKILAKGNRYSQALMEIERAMHLFDEISESMFILYSEVLMSIGNYSKAIEVYDELIVKSPGTDEYFLRKIRALAADGQLNSASDAISVFEKKVASNKYYTVLVKVEKGLLLGISNSAEEAEAYFMKMIESTDERKYGYFGLGKLKHSTSRMAESYFYLSRAKSMSLEDADIFISKNFRPYLQETKDRIILENKSANKENTENPFIKNISNQLSTIKSIKMVKDNVETGMSDSEEVQKGMMFLNENGGFDLSMSGLFTPFVYQIETIHNDKVIDLKIIPVDGTTPYIGRFAKIKTGYVYNRTAEIYMLFENAANLSDSQTAQKNKHLNLSEIEFLGEKAVSALS